MFSPALASGASPAIPDPATFLETAIHAGPLYLLTLGVILLPAGWVILRKSDRRGRWALVAAPLAISASAALWKLLGLRRWLAAPPDTKPGLFNEVSFFHAALSESCLLLIIGLTAAIITLIASVRPFRTQKHSP